MATREVVWQFSKLLDHATREHCLSMKPIQQSTVLFGNRERRIGEKEIKVTLEIAKSVGKIKIISLDESP